MNEVNNPPLYVNKELLVMKNKKILFHILGNLDIILAAVVLSMLVILTCLGVVMRYVVKAPFTWLEEVQLFCIVWIVFCGGGAAFRTGGHVAIEMIVDMFSPKIQKVIGFIIDIIVVAVIGYLFVESFSFIKMLYINGRSSNILDIPYWFNYGIAPVSYVVMIISYFYAKYFQKNEEEPV